MKALAIVAVLGVAASPGATNACSCIVPPGSEKSQVTREFNQANAVFIGYVHSESVRTVADNPNYSDEQKQMRVQIGVERERLVRVRVLQVWKGDLKRDSWIEMFADDMGGGGCGYPAEVDTAYIIFSHPQDSYAMSSCSNSGRVDVTSRFIALLDRLSKKFHSAK